MIDPFSIAFGLAKFAPDIIKWVTGDDKSAAVASKVVDIAKVVTGRENPAEVMDTLTADPELAIKFKTAVMENETTLEKLYMADLADARKRDAAFIAAGTRNYRADVLAGLAVCVVLAITYMVWKDPNIPEFMKGIVTLLMGRFLGYLDQIYQFEFGSTRSNKTKDETINRLTK